MAVRSSTADQSQGVQLITPARAEYWRTKCLFPRQRKIDVKRVRLLTRIMDANEFQPVSPVMLCVLPDGQELLVNGNHTLEAVRALGRPVTLLVTRLPVPDMDAAVRVYLAIDIQKIRTFDDAFRATGLAETMPNVRIIAPAVAVIDSDFLQDTNSYMRPEDMSRAFRVERTRAYQTEAALWREICDRQDKHLVRVLVRRAFLSVILETLKFQPDRASGFWRETLADDGLKQGHPGKALLKYGANSAVHHSAMRTHIMWAARAWNAFYQHRTLTRLRPQGYYFWLAGTPWSRLSDDPDQEADDAVQDETAEFATISQEPSFAGVAL